MGAGPSKERMLYDCVRTGNIHLIRTLHSEGTSPNWISSSRKTPLILACAAADRLPVAQTLIELGAEVNYYDPESTVGTALQRAADRGLEQTAILLLSHGDSPKSLHVSDENRRIPVAEGFNGFLLISRLSPANPLLCDVYRQNALDIARERGHTAIVRAIENKICFFSGWLRDISSTLRQNHLARIWAVVLPSDYTLSGNVRELLNIALYRDRLSPSPFNIISLKKYYVQEPIFFFPEPELVFSKKSSGRKLKFLSGEERDNEQLSLLYDACRGKTKTNHPSFKAAARATPLRLPPSSPMAVHAPSTSQEEVEIAMAISASIQSAKEEGIPLPDVDFGSHEEMRSYENTSPLTITGDRGRAAGEGTSGFSSSCVVCNDAPVEAACVPCGHLACCMACLTEVRMKDFGCPVCRARIKRIMKIYIV